MRLSFLGKTFNVSMPPFEALAADAAVSVKGQSITRNPFHIAQRHQPATRCRNAAKKCQAVQQSAVSKAYKVVALHWIDGNHLPTSKAFSEATTFRPAPPESREIEVKLPTMDAVSKLLLVIHVEETVGMGDSQVYQSHLVAIDKAAQKAIIQISPTGGSTDWTTNLRVKLVSVNSVFC